jgi:hypothetical protein
MLSNFLLHEQLCGEKYRKINSLEKIYRKIYLGHDPDPEKRYPDPQHRPADKSCTANLDSSNVRPPTNFCRQISAPLNNINLWHIKKYSAVPLDICNRWAHQENISLNRA